MRNFSFSKNPVGAILEYFVLRQTQSFNGPNLEQHAWLTANEIPDSHEPWNSSMPPTKTEIKSLFEKGKKFNSIQISQIDRIFRALDKKMLIEEWVKDGQDSTPFRVISSIGKELLADDLYLECIHGPKYIAEKWRQSVVKIVHANACNSGIGTGFVLAPNYIATASHVLEGLSQYKIILHDKTELTPKAAYRIKGMPDVDVAIIELPCNVPGVTPFKNSSGGEDLLDDVVIFGFPRVPCSDDAYLVINKGEISSKVTLLQTRGEVIIVSCLLRGGNSGGPVVNSRGKVIGIISQNLFNKLAEENADLSDGIGFAVAFPVYWAVDLIEKPEIREKI